MLEPGDLRELGLPIGQRKLLQQAVASLRTVHGPKYVVPDGVRNGVRVGLRETDETGGSSMHDYVDQDANAGLLGASSSGMKIDDIRRQAAALGSAGKTFDEMFSPPSQTTQVSHNPATMVATAKRMSWFTLRTNIPTMEFPSASGERRIRVLWRIYCRRGP